jgi:uridine kinase
MSGIDHAVETITSRGTNGARDVSLLVAVSGIDGAGKGTLTERITGALKDQKINAVSINLDGWHNAASRRFNPQNPAEHFYDHAFRFDELFRLLIDPLRRNRSIHLKTELTRLPENDFYLHAYDFDDVEVILLEGIFLLKRALRGRYDLALWIECSFETALKRARARNQEGLSDREIVRDYETIYFPAQRIHFMKDDPQSNADVIINND